MDLRVTTQIIRQWYNSHTLSGNRKSDVGPLLQGIPRIMHQHG